MAQSTHETRNPAEVSAKVQACMVLELDYTLDCFTADDGEKAYRLQIPELNLEKLFATSSPSTPKIVPIKQRAQQKRVSIADLAKKLSGEEN